MTAPQDTGLAHDDPRGAAALLAEPGDPQAPATERVRRPWWRTALSRSLPIIGALAGIAAVWYLVTYLVMAPSQRFLLPPPHQVYGDVLGNPAQMGPMLEALGRTFAVALVGLVIAVVLGMAWAVVMSQWRWAERILYPYAVILQTIPILALVPLIGIWMGYAFTARTTVCVIIAIFPMISNTLFGLQSATAAAHDLFTLNKATRWQRRRPGGDRRHRRRLLLPAGRPRHRRAAADLHLAPADGGPAHRGDPDRAVRRRRVPRVRRAGPGRRRPLVRQRGSLTPGSPPPWSSR
jgi:hypothetical protein